MPRQEANGVAPIHRPGLALAVWLALPLAVPCWPSACGAWRPRGYASGGGLDADRLSDPGRGGPHVHRLGHAKGVLGVCDFPLAQNCMIVFNKVRTRADFPLAFQA